MGCRCKGTGAGHPPPAHLPPRLPVGLASAADRRAEVATLILGGGSRIGPGLVRLRRRRHSGPTSSQAKTLDPQVKQRRWTHKSDSLPYQILVLTKPEDRVEEPPVEDGAASEAGIIDIASIPGAPTVTVMRSTL
jgi:hypothetical protein